MKSGSWFGIQMAVIRGANMNYCFLNYCKKCSPWEQLVFEATVGNNVTDMDIDKQSRLVQGYKHEVSCMFTGRPMLLKYSKEKSQYYRGED